MVGCSPPSGRHTKVPTVGLRRSKIPTFRVLSRSQLLRLLNRFVRTLGDGTRVRIRFASTARPTNLPPWSDCLRPPTAPRVCEGMGLSCVVAVGGEPSGRIDVTRCTAARLWVASSQVDGVDQRLPAASAHLDAEPFRGFE